MPFDSEVSDILTCWPTSSFFECFEPYPVQIEPIPVLVVHAETNKIAHPCMNGPMDTNSVKNGATVTDMRQKLNSTDFRHGFDWLDKPTTG